MSITLNTTLKTLATMSNAPVGVYASDDEFIERMVIYHHATEALANLPEEVLAKAVLPEFVDQEPNGVLVIRYEA